MDAALEIGVYRSRSRPEGCRPDRREEYVIVNQAHMLAYLRESKERSVSRLRPAHGLHASEVTLSSADGGDHPVTVTLQ